MTTTRSKPQCKLRWWGPVVSGSSQEASAPRALQALEYCARAHLQQVRLKAFGQTLRRGPLWQVGFYAKGEILRWESLWQAGVQTKEQYVKPYLGQGCHCTQSDSEQKDITQGSTAVSWTENKGNQHGVGPRTEGSLHKDPQQMDSVTRHASNRVLEQQVGVQAKNRCV